MLEVNMNLKQLKDELKILLPKFKDGRWEDSSEDVDGVIHLVLHHPDYTHEYVANLNEDKRPIPVILGIFDRY